MSDDAAAAAAPDEKKVCHGCKEDIAGGAQYVNVNDVLFHTEHFVCTGECKEALAGKPYLEKDGDFYCETDYLNKFHPKCGGCAKPLVGEYVTALEKQWHAECFVCKKCSAKFDDGKYQAVEQDPYCNKCYLDEFGDKCAKCEKPIESDKFEALGKKWHASCFVCTTGDHALDGDMKFQEHDGKVYCPEHYKDVALNKCAGCSKPIEGQFLHVGDKDFHVECLKCTHEDGCDKPATVQGSGDNFYCADCAAKKQKAAAAPAPAAE